MTGRGEIKGNIRKEGEDPHENRFRLRQIVSSPASKNVSFAKMSPRKGIIEGATEPLPSYDYNSEFGKKRLDSHIFGFDKQSNRKDLFPQTGALTEDYRTGSPLASLGHSIEWKKQLSRDGSGPLPGFMETVRNRTGVSLANFKTMRMNGSYVESTDRLQKRTKLTKSTVDKENFFD